MRPLLVASTLFASSTIATTACDTPVETADARPTVWAAVQASKAVSVSMSAPAAPPAIVPVVGKPVLWGYVDGAGVAHFASRQIDAHYSQVLRETESPHVTGKRQQPDGLLTWLEISPDVRAVQPLLNEAAKVTGVDEELLKAVIVVESSYNAHAVSPRGAVGMMQLTPAAADRYSTKEERRIPAAERLRDARINIFTGARMLADLTRRYGSIEVALAAWNAGESTVRKAGGHVPEIAETEAHVHMVLELYWALLQRNLHRHARSVQVDPSVQVNSSVLGAGRASSSPESDASLRALDMSAS